jgi:hypothetical protein
MALMDPKKTNNRHKMVVMDKLAVILVMKRMFEYIIIGLALLSCSDSLDTISGKNLYSYTDNQEFFPKKVTQDNHFYADRFVDKLKQLDEKSLVDKYCGHEIIRLTAVRSFRNHFTVLIERTENGVLLTEKETYRDSRPVNNGDTTKFTYDIIEFDSLTGKYMDVRKFMPVGTGSAIEVEIERKAVDPLLNNKSKEISTEEWNNLTKLLDNTSFFEMYPADSTTMVFDGHHYLIEIHSKNGYYVVERWSSESGDFKTIVDYIVGLSTYKEQ